MTSPEGQASKGKPLVSTGENPRFGVLRNGGFVHLTAKDTGGRLGMWETFPAAGAGPRSHTHTRETEIFQIMAGEFLVRCGDEQFRVGPSTAIALPPGVRHDWKNVGDTLGHLLVIVTPGGFEQFILESARMTTPDPSEVRALEERFGIVAGT